MTTEFRWLSPHTPEGGAKQKKRLQVKYTGTKIEGNSVKNVSSEWQDIPTTYETERQWEKRTERIVPNE